MRKAVQGAMARVTRARVISNLRRRHDGGIWAVAADREASDHYGLKPRGIGALVWSVRCYAAGFRSASKGVATHSGA